MTLTSPYFSPGTTIQASVHAKTFKADIGALEALSLWRGGESVMPLWDHQREAIALGVAYLRATDTSDEAALLKLPTGTGKSGIVSILARALPETRRVLVLTPRDGLVTQMIDDIGHRFWRTMRLTDLDKGCWDGDGIAPATIVRLLPNARNAARLRGAAKSPRCVIVGTLQALDQLRSQRELIQQRARAGDVKEKDAERLGWISGALEDLASLDAVIVDEGHYEPAPSWSRSVRSLGLPTLLMSATPFRNDYKLFSVRGGFAYNLPFQQARAGRIIRDVAFAALGVSSSAAPAPFDASDEDSATPSVLAPEEGDAVRAFATRLAAQAATLVAAFPNIPHPKIIVRAASFEALQLLQAALDDASGDQSVLLHERAGTDAGQPGKSAADLNRFVRVRDALKKRPEARYWLHQTKLLEGIDEPSFVAVALYDGFSNARQLVQQIGRVIRSSDATRQEDQTATVLLRDDDALARTSRSWNQYLSFEEDGAEKLSSIIPGEAYLPQKIIPQMPDRQYVDGAFRERLPLSLALSKDDLLVPQRAVIFDRIEGYDREVLRAEAQEGILARNRFVVTPVSDLPDGVSAWTYFTVDESPYLANHYVTEWRFGLSVIAEVGGRLFVFDTDGVPFDPAKVGVRRLARHDIARLFEDSSTDPSVRITRMSASSMDMSPRAVRATTTSTNSFADTFTDLLDPFLLPTNVAGYVDGTGRYLGLTRGKVSDATAERVPIDAYLDWARGIDAQLSKVADASRVFSRFVQTATPDPVQAKAPKSLLFDLEPVEDFGSFLREAPLQAAAGAPVGLLDLCVDIDAKGEFSVTTETGDALPGRIVYLPKSRRYRIESMALDQAAIPKGSAARRAKTFTATVNESQAFRVLTEEVDKVYMHGEWVKARDLVVDGVVMPLANAKSVPALKKTTVEKGEADWLKKPAAWKASSIFGLTKHYLDRAPVAGADAYEEALVEFPLVLLDDDGSELCDFVLVSDTKVVLLHAKASAKGSKKSVTALQEVGRQAVASLAFYSTPALSIDPDRWERSYTANKTKMTGVSRIFRNNAGIANADLSAHVRRAFVDPSRSREVWIVLGNLIDLAEVETAARSSPITYRVRQLLMFIDSLSTSCGRANAVLRIFG
ncbi:DEAD/DEAH box helicase family protein [uncultured Brevundimonas sp.]|uniref:DEAD/DEAH box helicase n=1 Tax=uncultured Brevundimonas sp. TaxID=213418 RepID=UPI0025D7036E|nr:DEAD/DEAH box helicase family protein [uncultured Brevundimonas sp.]